MTSAIDSFEEPFQGNRGPEDRIAIDLLSLILRIVIDKTDGLKPNRGF